MADWITLRNRYFPDWRIPACSECHCTAVADDGQWLLTLHCPSCGAKMSNPTETFDDYANGKDDWEVTDEKYKVKAGE